MGILHQAFKLTIQTVTTTVLDTKFQWM